MYKEAIAEPVQNVEDQLAKAPTPPRSRPALRFKSKVSAFVAVVTRNRGRGFQDTQPATNRSPQVASTDTQVTGNQASSNLTRTPSLA